MDVLKLGNKMREIKINDKPQISLKAEVLESQTLAMQYILQAIQNHLCSNNDVDGMMSLHNNNPFKLVEWLDGHIQEMLKQDIGPRAEARMLDGLVEEFYNY